MLPSITEHIEVVLRPQLSYSNVSDIWNFSHEHGEIGETRTERQRKERN